MLHAILTGNLGNDPDMRYTPSGVPVTSFSVASNRKWKDANGEEKEKTTWVRVSVWRNQAEACAKHLKKGSKVSVIGEIEPPKIYTDRDGQPATGIELTASSVEFLGGGEQRHPGETETSVHQPAEEGQRRKVTSEDIPF